MKTRLQISQWITRIVLLALLCPVAIAGSGDYYKHILHNGKLQRFNDTTRVVYYRLDALENSKNWDYTKWNFIKDELVKQAFTDWENALGGRLMFRETNDPKKTDIAVHWRNGFDDRHIMGVERPNVTYGDTLVAADVEITLTSGGKVLGEKTIKSIALHEIGHALGMNGHSPYAGDIMYPSIQTGVSKLSVRDIDTIRKIYDQKPQITNPAGVHLAQYRQSLELYQKGMQAYQSHNYAKAAKFFAQASKLHPKEPDYAMMAGMAAYQAKDYPDAIVHLQKIAALPGTQQIEIQASLADAMMQQGQADMKNGKAQRGAQYLTKSRDAYTKLLKNPKTPAEIKKDAMAKRKWLDQHLKTLSASR